MNVGDRWCKGTQYIDYMDSSSTFLVDGTEEPLGTNQGSLVREEKIDECSVVTWVIKRLKVNVILKDL